MIYYIYFSALKLHLVKVYNIKNTEPPDAIGFGWIQTQIKNGKEYTSIRWETLNNYNGIAKSPLLQVWDG